MHRSDMPVIIYDNIPVERLVFFNPCTEANPSAGMRSPNSHNAVEQPLNPFRFAQNPSV
jgi:hypothetical protein